MQNLHDDIFVLFVGMANALHQFNFTEKSLLLPWACIVSEIPDCDFVVASATSSRILEVLEIIKEECVGKYKYTHTNTKCLPASLLARCGRSSPSPNFGP